MPLNQLSEQDLKEDVQNANNPNDELKTEKQKCPYTQMRADLHDKLKRIENVDTVVNLSVVVMVLVAMVQSSLCYDAALRIGR
ncbi:hypothetical protein Bca52824_079397 [Brassica carinata]|uniref:Uncharacterized protein n=1 Tax=Brassica carinata TaxID=52824 RepID=A0A8X7Q115_BRACI|nr:hypothetical protein Bca52824_079397 [Brassica carinata]